MTGKVTGQKSLFLSIRKFLCIAVHTSLLQWINVEFTTFWGNSKKKDGFDSTCLVPTEFPSLVPMQMVWGSEVTQAMQALQWEDIRFSHGYSGSCGTFPWWCAGRKELNPTLSPVWHWRCRMASKGEEELAPCCLYVAKSWNGTAEMQSLEHPETRHPLMLGLVPSPKGKGSQNYHTLYDLLITVSWNKSLPRASFLQQPQVKKPHLSNALAEPLCCWVLGTDSPFSPPQGCAEIHKPSLCFFFFPAPNSSIL